MIQGENYQLHGLFFPSLFMLFYVINFLLQQKKLDHFISFHLFGFITFLSHLSGSPPLSLDFFLFLFISLFFFSVFFCFFVHFLLSFLFLSFFPFPFPFFLFLFLFLFFLFSFFFFSLFLFFFLFFVFSPASLNQAP